jgi:hypothetical protein
MVRIRRCGSSPTLELPEGHVSTQAEYQENTCSTKNITNYFVWDH